MTVRTVAAALALAVVGVAGGFGLATVLSPDPQQVADTTPLAASDPSQPAGLPVVRRDPSYPPLAPGLPTSTQVVPPKSFGVRVPVPTGWERNDNGLGEVVWTDPDAPTNTYLLRVKLVSSLRLTVTQALDQRRAALQNAVDDWHLEDETDDTFVADYVNDGYRRLAMERFVAVDGSEQAWATIVVVGRLEDRDGLVDLLDRVTDGWERSASFS